MPEKDRPKRKLPIGISDFRTLREENRQYAEELTALGVTDILKLAIDRKSVV